jgi:spore germination protein YaaH
MAQYSSPAGPYTIAAAPTSGVAQVETTPIVGTITGDGNATFTITGTGITGSPLAISVPVLNGDTPTVVAAKAAVVVNATAAVAALYVASSVAADFKLTAIKAEANDATLNIAYTNGTCTGLTPDATSDNTTAGVLGDFRGLDAGAYLVDTTNKKVYKNTGSAYVQTWTLQ